MFRVIFLFFIFCNFLFANESFLSNSKIENNIEIINALIPEIAIFFILLGSFLSLFFYNIFLYLSTKEKEYFLYSIFILFLVLWMSSFQEYFIFILGFNLEIINIIKIFALLGTSIFLLLFSFKFLDIQNRYSKKWYFLFLTIFFLFFIKESFSYFLSMLTLICVTFFCLYLGIQKFIQGYNSSKYYLLALGGYLMGVIISFCMFEGFLEENFYTLQIQLIGTIWAMIFLSLALGYKFSLVQLERNDAILKSQVQEKILFLQSRQASVGELVGNIAHQWREPLAEIGAIQTNLHATLLIKGVLSKEKILDSIEQSSGIIRHLSDTIDVFYRFFKHEKSNKSEFSLIEVMHDVRKMVHYILEVENISFLFEYKDEIYLFGDRNEFANAILNIILNAKDVLVDRKVTNPYIKINIEEVDNRVVITVEDNAGGIKQEPIEKIFESCVSSKPENIGIGLYIVKTIIEKRLRGKIAVKNSEFGAIFTITLPLNSETKEEEFVQTSLKMEESTLERIYRLERKVEKQVELEKTLRQWEDIFKQTHWAVSVHNGKNNQFEMVNPAFYEMYGYTQINLEYMNLENLFSPSSLDILYIKQKEAFEKCFSSFEAVHLRKDGSSFPVNIDLTVIKNENGDILYHIANIRDISEQKNVNKSLLLKKFALNHIHEAVYLMDETGKFKYVNKAACLALGYSEDELLQLNIGDVDADWPIERWPEHWNIIKHIKTMTMELRHKRKDGTIFPVEVLANYFEYDGMAYNMGLARDISERKVAEENLLLKEFALNKINESVFLIDENANFHYVNEATCKSLGYSQEELLKLSVPDIDNYVSLEWWKEHWNDIKFNNTLTLTEHKRKNGTTFPIEISSNYFEYNGIEYSLAVSRDITERLIIQKRKDEEKMRLFFDHELVGMAITSPTKGWLHVNDKLCEMLGFSSTELKSMTWTQITHPDDLSIDIDNFDSMLLGKIDFYTIEKRYICKDKSIIYTNLSISCVRKEDDSVDYVLALIEDITRRKEIEKELADSYDFLNHLIDSLPDPIFVKDRNHKWIILNKANCELTGLPNEYLIGKSDYDIFPKEEADVFWEKDELVFNSNEVNVNEEYFTSKDGVTHCIETVKSMFIGSDGNQYLVGIIRDISERKAVQKRVEQLNEELEEKVVGRTIELAKKEREFRTLAENMPDLLSRYDKEGRRIYVNPSLCNYFGISSDELIGFTPQGKSLIGVPKELYEKIHYVLQTAQRTQMEVNIVKDGKELWWNIIFAPEFDEHGEIEGVISIGHDITEIKEAQIKITQESEKFSKLFMSSPAAVSLTSIDRNIYLEVNESFLYFTKYTREEVVGKSSEDLRLFANPDERAKFFTKVLEEGVVRGFEFEYCAKDGTIGYGLAYATILYLNGEKYLLSHSYDINSTKQLEMVSTALNSTSEAVYITDENFSIIYVNESACKMLGYTKEEFSSKKVYEIDALYSLENLSTLQEDKQSNKNIVFETKHRMKNGNIIDVEIAGSSFIFHDKIVYLSVVKDITIKKEYESKLKLLELAINRASDAIYIVDDDRSIQYVSDAACRMLGYTYDEFLSMKVEDIDPFMPIVAMNAVRDNVTTTTSKIFQTKHKTKDGKIVDVEITVTKFIHNNITLRLSIAKDITERKKDQNALIELNNTLEQKVIDRTNELQQALEFNKSIIQAIPDMLFEVSKEGVYLNVWARDEKLLATQKELLLGKNFRDILPLDAVEVSIKTMKEVDMYGSSLGNSYKLDFADGEHWFELHSTIKEPEGNYLALAREITERKKAQDELLNLNITLEEKVKERTHALQKALEWSEDIINTLPDILFEMDKKGNYLGVWTQNKELLAQQKEVLLGNNIYNVLSKESANTIIEALEEANIEKFSSGKRISINLPQGIKEFELSISKKSDGNFLLLSRDISQRV